jgi:phosphoribosylglycinamide formyltransferase-1
MKKIVIFASGNGSNAENIMRFFDLNVSIKVVAIFTNNSSAKVIEKATNRDIPVEIFEKSIFTSPFFESKLAVYSPDVIILAGFLLKFPENLVRLYPEKIINIHPALLPKYGGKGMYGLNVHQAVLAHHEKETGITIHYVNEHYDEGKCIFQKAVNIESCSTAEEIAQKVQNLEHQYLPKVIEDLLIKN